MIARKPSWLRSIPELALKISRGPVMCFPYDPGPMAFSKDVAKQKRLSTSLDWRGCITPRLSAKS
jgi:hypothetical protein